jgi:hypothetical protein
MTAKFPTHVLPEYYTQLLRVNMQSTGSVFSNLSMYIHENRSLYAIVEKVTKSPNGKSEEISEKIKNHGWFGIRNKVCSAYLYYLKNGNYPNAPAIEMIDSILRIEERLRPFAVRGFSRSFLLGFYLESVALSIDGGELLASFLDKKFLALLDISNSRTHKIDWVMILLYHFKDFLGYDKLLDLLNNGSEYEQIYTQLSQDQQALLMKNLLAYGCSISESESFFTERV